jgi:hypothetical protein
VEDTGPAGPRRMIGQGAPDQPKTDDRFT